MGKLGLFKNLSSNVRAVRKELGLTQDQLAKLIGVSSRLVREMEKDTIGETNLKHLYFFSNRFNIAISELFRNESLESKLQNKKRPLQFTENNSKFMTLHSKDSLSQLHNLKEHINNKDIIGDYILGIKKNSNCGLSYFSQKKTILNPRIMRDLSYENYSTCDSESLFQDKYGSLMWSQIYQLDKLSFSAYLTMYNYQKEPNYFHGFFLVNNEVPKYTFAALKNITPLKESYI
jgi:DNA-binding XRE family transcriptional regulator